MNKKMRKILIAVSLILVIFIGYKVISKNITAYEINTKGEAVYSLTSNRYWFCEWIEQSSPAANLSFAYEVKGNVLNIETVTTCKDFPANPFPSPTEIVAEKLKLFPNAENPKLLLREDGTIYKVKLLSHYSYGNGVLFNRDMYWSPEDIARIKINHKEELYNECNKINDSNQKTNCLSYYNQIIN